LLIYLWVNDELNVDKFHEKGSQLFRVMLNDPSTEGIRTAPSTQAILAEALAEDMPEIEYAVTTTGGTIDFNLSAGDTYITAAGIFAEKDFFTIFSFDLIQGDKNIVLSDKKGVALSEATAIALFNTTEDIIGKAIEWQFPWGKEEAFVSGVFKNISPNSSSQFDFVLSFDIYKDIVGKESLHWGNYGCNTFVVLKKGANIQNFNLKIEHFVKRKAGGSNVTLFVRPYSEYYLYGNYENGVQAGGRIEYVTLFTIIGIFILTIACINFMNLATAKASRRIKEVGIKKAIGANRKTLIFQYLGESMLLTFLSLLIAVLMVDLLLPQFNAVTGKHLYLNLNPNLILSLTVLILFTGLIAGSYPALYLSGFKPAAVLKGRFNTQPGSIVELFARKGLIVFQFTLSIIFIIAVLVIYKQIEFLQNKHLGYDKDNIIYFRPEGRVAQRLETFLTEIKKIPGVVNASSIARSIVGAQNSTTGSFHWEGKDPKAIIPFQLIDCNYDMIETLGIEMKEGRAFSREFTADTSSIIFNEAGIEVMGLKNPVGKIFNLWGKDLKIVGVTKNFHFESLHEKVKPLFFRLVPEEADRFMVKLLAGKEKETIERVKQFYKNFNPGFSFDYKFLDQEYQAQYNAEKRVAALSKYFAGLTILISCLGLFGLAAFTAERRFKEIGIRKVLGSSVFGIVWLLSSDFTKIVFVSILIALPLSYFITKYWLDSFAFKIELEWWYFIGAGVASLFIAWLTVGTQAIKAARINPTQCLHNE
jgi:ABC-type antimicrobial peptide transport system permease subunit